MRPTLFIATGIVLMTWLSPGYAKAHVWHWLMHLLSGAWFQHVGYVMRPWNWVPQQCDMSSIVGQVVFMHVPIALALGATWISGLGRRCDKIIPQPPPISNSNSNSSSSSNMGTSSSSNRRSRGSSGSCGGNLNIDTGSTFDWYLRLIAFGAALNVFALAALVTVPNLQCEQSRHGGTCTDVIAEGASSVATLATWIDTIWMRAVAIVMMIAEGWRARMSFHKVMLYALYSMFYTQMLAWPLWLLEYRGLKRTNDIVWWWANAAVVPNTALPPNTLSFQSVPTHSTTRSPSFSLENVPSSPVLSDYNETLNNFHASSCTTPITITTATATATATVSSRGNRAIVPPVVLSTKRTLETDTVVGSPHREPTSRSTLNSRRRRSTMDPNMRINVQLATRTGEISDVRNVVNFKGSSRRVMTPQHRRHNSMQDLIAEPGVTDRLDIDALLRNTAHTVDREHLARNPSPYSSDVFPTLESTSLLDFDVHLQHLIPLGYVLFAGGAAWTWLTWMNVHVRNHCWLDGFLEHFFDSPASLLMNTGPLWGVFVWVAFIWSTEPCFRTTEDIQRGIGPRYVNIMAAWVCSIVSFNMVAVGMALYLAWREFRMHYVPSMPSTSFVRTDQSVWYTSAELSVYLPESEYVEGNFVRHSATCNTSTASILSPSTPSTPAQTSFGIPRIPHDPNKASSTTSTISLKASTCVNSSSSSFSNSSWVDVGLIFMSMKNSLWNIYELLQSDVYLSTLNVMSLSHRFGKTVWSCCGFAPLPRPTPRRSFLDWSLLLPFVLLMWVFALNIFAVCWMFSFEDNFRDNSVVVTLFVAFGCVIFDPPRTREIYAWLFFSDDQPRQQQQQQQQQQLNSPVHAASLQPSPDASPLPTNTMDVSPLPSSLDISPMTPSNVSYDPASYHNDDDDRTMTYVHRLGAAASSHLQLLPIPNPFGRLRLNSHLMWTTVSVGLMLFATILVNPRTQFFPFPWQNYVFARVRQLTVDDFHRHPTVAAANIVLLCVIGLLAWFLFFGFQLRSPSLQRGMPRVSWRLKMAIVWPLVFIFAVVWPHVTQPCTIELGKEDSRITPEDLITMESAIQKAMLNAYSNKTGRLVHPKTHGCVQATFQTLPDAHLSSKFRHGLFARTDTWPAYVRFSSGASPRPGTDGVWSLQPDSVPDVRGMSVKVIFDNDDKFTDTHIRHQDFVSISSNYFFQENAQEYTDFVGAAASANIWSLIIWLMPRELTWKGLMAYGYRLRTLYLAYWMNRDGGRVTNPLRAEYFSATPYRLGPEHAQATSDNMRPATAVKYRWKPCSPRGIDPTRHHAESVRTSMWRWTATAIEYVNAVYQFVTGSQHSLFHSSYFDMVEYRDAQEARHNSENFLRVNMHRTLNPYDDDGDGIVDTSNNEALGACFDLLLQDQTNACVNSLEDPSRVWRGEWVRAARLVIPKQTFLAESQLDMCRRTEYNPWNSLSVHRPLGDINKLRRVAYQAAASVRRQIDVMICSSPVPVLMNQSLELRGSTALYSYGTYPEPFQSLPKKIAISPHQERMSNSVAANVRNNAIFSFQSASYPQQKLHGEFARPQDYEFLHMGDKDDVEYLNTNHASSGRMRRPLHVNESIWTDDVWWARQFAMGPNPMMIQRVTSLQQLPRDMVMPTSDSQEADRACRVLAQTGDCKTVGDAAGFKSALEYLAREGRVFFVDYAELQDTLTFQDRVLYAPLVLLYLASTSPERTLLPIFIQLERSNEVAQRSSSKRPRIYFPAKYVIGAPVQSNRVMVWLFARMHVSCADSVMHQLVSHLLESHLAFEPVIIATHRSFEQTHPVMRLLRPHLTGTIAVNEFGRTTLVSDMQAQVDELLATGLQGSLQLMARYYNRTYTFMETLPQQLTRRGFTVSMDVQSKWDGSDDELPGFLYRDYGMALWLHMRAYVRDVLNPIYGATESERDVSWKVDVGVKTWLHELHSESGAHIRASSASQPQTFAEFVDLVTQLIFQASAQHAAVNFGMYEHQTFQPARPLFLTRSMPDDLTLVDERFVLGSLMQPETVGLLFSIMDILSSCCVDTLVQLDGHIGLLELNEASDVIEARTTAFPGAHRRFQHTLMQLETRMRHHNERHSYHYPYLLPSRVPRSTAM